MPPLVSFGLSPDQHFERSMKIAERTLPSERSVMMDEDLKFAAAMMVGRRVELKKLRDEAIKAVRLLKCRWLSITARMRKAQSEGIRQVTMARDIGLLTLLSIILICPDYTFSEHLVWLSSSGTLHVVRCPSEKGGNPFGNN